MFQVVKDNFTLEIIFSSTLDNIDRACEVIQEFLDALGLNEHVFGFLLVTREAVLNAVIHGNRRDKSLVSKVGLKLEDDKAVITVEDQGRGWSWNSKDVRLPDSDKTSGRGLFIIDRYTDKFYYNDKGNVLTMEKNFASDEVQMSEIRRQGTTATIRPGKNILASTADEFKGLIKSLIHDGVTELTLDCVRMTMLDSIGVGILVAAHNSLSSVGGKLYVANTNSDIYDLLTMMRLDKHFNITKSS